jgi:hypothetical protein
VPDHKGVKLHQHGTICGLKVADAFDWVRAEQVHESHYLLKCVERNRLIRKVNEDRSIARGLEPHGALRWNEHVSGSIRQAKLREEWRGDFAWKSGPSKTAGKSIKTGAAAWAGSHPKSADNPRKSDLPHE